MSLHSHNNISRTYSCIKDKIIDKHNNKDKKKNKQLYQNKKNKNNIKNKKMNKNKSNNNIKKNNKININKKYNRNSIDQEMFSIINGDINNDKNIYAK